MQALSFSPRVFLFSIFSSVPKVSAGAPLSGSCATRDALWMRCELAGNASSLGFPVAQCIYIFFIYSHYCWPWGRESVGCKASQQQQKNLVLQSENYFTAIQCQTWKYGYAHNLNSGYQNTKRMLPAEANYINEVLVTWNGKSTLERQRHASAINLLIPKLWKTLKLVIQRIRGTCQKRYIK